MNLFVIRHKLTELLLKALFKKAQILILPFMTQISGLGDLIKIGFPPSQGVIQCGFFYARYTCYLGNPTTILGCKQMQCILIGALCMLRRLFIPLVRSAATDPVCSNPALNP